MSRLRLVLLVLALGGCAGDAERPLLVLAASDLLDAFEELAPRFEAESGIPVEVVLGSTGLLAQQIRFGAPADLFFAANEAFLDGLVEAGRILPESRRLYAVGRLAVAVPGGDAPELPELNDPRYRILVIANPDHAPYGDAAREALVSAGIWTGLEGRLVLADNVAHALQFIVTGNADAGVVALSLLMSPRGAGLSHRLVDDALHTPLRQAAGIPGDAAQPEDARRFLDFVLSEAGQEILSRYGFDPPPRD